MNAEENEEEEVWKGEVHGETSQSLQESMEGEDSVEDLNDSPPPGSRGRSSRSKFPGAGLSQSTARGVRFAKGGSTANLHARRSLSHRHHESPAAAHH